MLRHLGELSRCHASSGFGASLAFGFVRDLFSRDQRIIRGIRADALVSTDQVILASVMSATLPVDLGEFAFVTTRSIFSACRRMRLQAIEMSSSVVDTSEYLGEADAEK
jgi:hypothetical protein